MSPQSVTLFSGVFQRERENRPCSTYGLQRTCMIVRSGHTDTAVVPAESACDRQTRAVLGRTVPCAVRAHFLSLPSTVPVVAAEGAPAAASPV